MSRGAAFIDKIAEAEKSHIYVPQCLKKVANDKLDYKVDDAKYVDIWGIYKFFIFDPREQKEFEPENFDPEKIINKKYFYIGSSAGICKRLFSSDGNNGHIYKYVAKQKTPKSVSETIKEKLVKNRGCCVGVEIIEVDCKIKNCIGEENFALSAHHLKLREYQEIVKHLENGECLNQLPESCCDEGYWEGKIKLMNNKINNEVESK